MIILDTNVISEPMKPLADPRVQRWLNTQRRESLHITTTSLAEIRAGIEQLPSGKRKQQIDHDSMKLIANLFGDRVLPFDQEAAIIYGILVAKARGKGRSILIGDGQIAAVAKVHGFTVATRDVNPFLAAGLKVIDPWKTSPQGYP